MIKTLEYPITASNHANCFYYFSGLRMSFIPTSNPGERIVEITDENGKAIDTQRVYTIAVMDGGVPEENCQSVEDTGAIINDLLIETITEQKKFLQVQTAALKSVNHHFDLILQELLSP